MCDDDLTMEELTAAALGELAQEAKDVSAPEDQDSPLPPLPPAFVTSYLVL